MSTYGQAIFLKSAWQPAQFVADEGAEVAFAGRSNAGKSSAINAIVGRTSLARTSKTPGQTQLINFFALAEGHRLVDLPGYGYAKVPARMRRHWLQLMSRYFDTRVSLAGVFLVMDARRPLLEFDWQLLEWVKARALPAHLVVTKSDKLGRGEATRTLKRVREATAAFASSQLFSATTRVGVDEARATLEAMLGRRWRASAEGTVNSEQ
jgi:GTP-binding protein